MWTAMIGQTQYTICYLKNHWGYNFFSYSNLYYKVYKCYHLDFSTTTPLSQRSCKHTNNLWLFPKNWTTFHSWKNPYTTIFSLTRLTTKQKTRDDKMCGLGNNWKQVNFGTVWNMLTQNKFSKNFQIFY